MSDPNNYMKPVNFFFMCIGFVISFILILVFGVIGFIYQSIKEGFEIGQGVFEMMNDQVKKSIDK